MVVALYVYCTYIYTDVFDVEGVWIQGKYVP